MRKSLLALFTVLALVPAPPAAAQAPIDGGPDPASVRVRIGPLMMNPTISVTNLGIDHNVFNDPPDKAPKQDFTVTVTPLSDFWLHLGPTWLTGSMNEAINWYQKYASERTANNTYKLGWRVPGPRVSFRVEGSYINARERPGFEIDTRAARKETLFSAAADIHTLSKSTIGVSASRQQTRFADDAEYLDTNLKTSLNRIDTSYSLNLRHQLTPLTTVTFSAAQAYSKFEFSPDRDTTATSGTVSVAFAPEALLRGGGSFGYENFVPADPTLPAYKGLIGTADLTYVLLGSTRFALITSRGVQYSYDVLQPYYVQSRISGSVAQQIFGPFDVQVRGDLAYLAYRNRAGAVVAVPDRTDRVVTYGIGLGIHMGRDLRLAFNVDQNNRDTKLAEHGYDKFLVGTSLIYGF
ncbi:MAG: hypothetical protein JWL71_4703 [Acidobacteria bacterium]|nr:hypothetical protein [Acidobacteriota bacterium]